MAYWTSKPGNPNLDTPFIQDTHGIENLVACLVLNSS